MKISTAIHISMCIPLYFKPVAIDSNWNAVSIKESTAPYDIYVDGGMLCNYPINMFDTCIKGGNPLLCDDVKYNIHTLGLKLESAEQIANFDKNLTEIAPYKITSVNKYVVALINLMTETLNRKTPGLKNEIGRSIFISYNDIFGKPRKVSAATKKILFDNGVAAVEKFFNSNQPTSK
jgi:NTE family protein